jgi:hypothetical protein
MFENDILIKSLLDRRTSSLKTKQNVKRDLDFIVRRQKLSNKTFASKCQLSNQTLYPGVNDCNSLPGIHSLTPRLVQLTISGKYTH